MAGCGERDLLVAVTEKRSADEIDRYVEALRNHVEGGAS